MTPLRKYQLLIPWGSSAAERTDPRFTQGKEIPRPLKVLNVNTPQEIIHVWTQPFRQNNDESFKVLSTMTPPLFDHI
jgi:hypothetical protein